MNRRSFLKLGSIFGGAALVPGKRPKPPVEPLTFSQVLTGTTKAVETINLLNERYTELVMPESTLWQVDWKILFDAVDAYHAGYWYGKGILWRNHADNIMGQWEGPLFGYGYGNLARTVNCKMKPSGHVVHFQVTGLPEMTINWVASVDVVVCKQ